MKRKEHDRDRRGGACKRRTPRQNWQKNAIVVPPSSSQSSSRESLRISCGYRPAPNGLRSQSSRKRLSSESSDTISERCSTIFHDEFRDASTHTNMHTNESSTEDFDMMIGVSLERSRDLSSASNTEAPRRLRMGSQCSRVVSAPSSVLAWQRVARLR